jgi:hypothetical protein
MAKKMDINNMNNQLIIAGMTGLVDDGLSPHEVFDVLEDIKRNIFPALAEIHQENKKGATKQ